MTLFSKYRAEAGMTLADAAEEFRVPQSLAECWEAGSVEPPIQVIRSLDLMRSFAAPAPLERVSKALFASRGQGNETVDILERGVDATPERRHQSKAMKPRVMATGDLPALDGAADLTISRIRRKVRQGSAAKPRLLDLFCCAGGAAVGYARAGFEVVGVDIVDRPNFPLTFIKADAMELDDEFIASFDAIHASPPCQSYSDLAKRNGNAHEWPRLIEPVREMLVRSGKPYVIENVEGAPLINPVVLCGTMFPGLRVLRHRLFEANFEITPPPHKKHPKVHTFDKRKSHFGKTNEWVDFVQVTGGGNSSLAAARDAMGIDWMTKGEINEAIPPAYTKLIGDQLMVHIAAEAAAAHERRVA